MADLTPLKTLHRAIGHSEEALENLNWRNPPTWYRACTRLRDAIAIYRELVDYTARMHLPDELYEQPREQLLTLTRQFARNAAAPGTPMARLQRSFVQYTLAAELADIDSTFAAVLESGSESYESVIG